MKGTITVVVETPRGSTVKYAWDQEHRAFALRKVFPLGYALPYDFGFVPGTHAEDGDPVDAIVLSDFGTFPGCVIPCRLIGAITATQLERGKRKAVRNDRLIVVPEKTRVFSQVKTLDQLPAQVLDDLEHFFTGYNEAAGKRFTPTARLSAKAAMKLLEQAR